MLPENLPLHRLQTSPGHRVLPSRGSTVGSIIIVVNHSQGLQAPLHYLKSTCIRPDTGQRGADGISTRGTTAPQAGRHRTSLALVW